MSLYQRVALAETQGFLRAKVAAKEQLCSQVIGENQQLLRQLEDSQAGHRQAVDRIKAEASAVVQQLLANTAVYRDTHENLLRKLELQERQAANDALRARHAERHRQEAEEKLLVLKRFVAGLQEKQKRLEEEAHAFTTAFKNVKSAIQTFAASLAACKFSEDDKASLEQLPEMVSLGINRMQLVLSDAEARLLEKGFVKEVSAAGILQSITGDKPATMVPAAEASRLQRERKMWENKYVRMEKELRAKEKELNEIKKENTRKADVLLKLRLKDHRFKLKDAEFAAAKAKTLELQAQLEKLRKERDELVAWKSSHPVYKGYRWDHTPTKKPASTSRSPPRAEPPAKGSQSAVDPALRLLGPRELSKVSQGIQLARSPSRASLASSRRVSSVTSVPLPSRKLPASPSVHELQRTAKDAVPFMPAKAVSAPTLLDATDGEPAACPSPRASRVSLEGTGMTMLKRGSRSHAPAVEATQKAHSGRSGSPTPQLARARSLTPLGESKAPSRAPSIGAVQHHLTLRLPSTPRSVVTPVFAHETGRELGTGEPPTSDAAVHRPQTTGDPNRLAAFFSTAFSKAAAREKEGIGPPTQQKQKETEAQLSFRKGRLDRKISSSRVRGGGSVASIRTLASGGRRVHIDLKPTEEAPPEPGQRTEGDDQPLSPKTQIARSQAIAFMEGIASDTSRRVVGAQTVRGPHLHRLESFASETSVRTLRSPSAAAITAAVISSTRAAPEIGFPISTEDKGTATNAPEKMTAGVQQQGSPRRLVGVDLGGSPPDLLPRTAKKAVAAAQGPGEDANSLNPKETTKGKTQEGRSPPDKANLSSSQAKEEASTAKDRVGAAAPDASSAEVEDILHKYLGGSVAGAGGPKKAKPARERAVSHEERRNSRIAGGGHSIEEGDAWKEKESLPLSSEKRTGEAGTPGGALQWKTAAPPSTKTTKQDLLGKSPPVQPPRTSHMEAAQGSGTEPQVVVRLGTRAGAAGGPSRTITGVRKAPPKLIERSNASPESKKETAQAPLRVAAGSAPSLPAPAAEAATALAVASKSEAPSFSSVKDVPHSPPAGASTDGLWDTSSGRPPEGEDKVTHGGGQQRKRMSAGDVSTGSWAMAAPKLNINIVKAPKHETRDAGD